MKTRLSSSCHVQSLFALTCGVLLWSAGGVSAQILNGSFELQGGTRQQAESWTLFGESYRSNQGPAKRDGSWGIIMSALLPSAGDSSGAFQTLPASAGEQWTFSGFVCNDVLNAGQVNPGDAIFLRLEFTGSYGKVTNESPHLDYNMPGDTWVPLSTGGTAPDGTTSVTFSAILFQEEQRPGGNAWFDDFSATVQVPEPAAVSLLVLGVGMGWVLRRTAVTRRAVRAAR